MKFNTGLVLSQCEAQTAEEAVKALCGLMEAQGMVKDSYCEAVLKREKTYPTGVPTAFCDVAIPHAPSEHVLQPGFAVAQLKQPVRFYSMGDADQALEVKVVFLLAVKDPRSQLDMLKSLMGAFESEEIMSSILNARTPEEIARVVEQLGQSVKEGL